MNVLPQQCHLLEFLRSWKILTRSSFFRAQCYFGLFCSLLLIVSSAAWAVEAETKFDFNVAVKAVDLALTEFAEQADLTLVFPDDLVQEKQANELVGRYTLQEGAEILLSGTGLTPEFSNKVVLSIRTDEESASGEESMTVVKKAGLAAVLAAFFSAGVNAQENAGDNKPVLEEIVVTASKRAMNLQDVPASITAIGAEEMQKRGLVSMNDYLRTIPSVSYIERGAGQNAVVVRGISADPQQEGFNSGPTVGVYLGEMPLSSIGVFGSVDIRLIDIERVEVLRGPQGTLYGSSALGGAVRYVPKSPDLSEVSGSLEAVYSQTGEEGGANSELSGVLNLPLIEDRLGVRGVVYRLDNSGYVNNIAGSDASRVAAATAYDATSLLVDQQEVGSEVTLGGRISLYYQPSDNFSATLSYLNQDSEQSGSPYSQPDLGKWTQSEYQPGRPVLGKEQGLLDKTEITSLNLTYQMAWGEILSSSTFMERRSETLRDLDFLFGVPTPQYDEWNTDAFVQEVRLTSLWEGPLQFVSGYYYEDFEVNQQEFVYFGGGDSQLNPYVVGEDILYDFNRTEFIEQHAVYGEIAYSFSEAFSLTLGGRAFQYDRRTLQATGGFFGGAALDDPNISDLSSDDSGSNFKLNASYHVNDDALLYAQWSEGFRLGRPISPVPANICDLDNDGIFDGTSLPIDTSSTNPDTLQSYELGGKFSLSDGNVRINAAVFHNDWEGIPVNVLGTCQLSLLANAGVARTQGIEIESQFYLTPSLSLSAGFSFLNAELADDAPAVNGASGDRLPGSPETTFNLGVSYEFDISRYAAFVRSDYSYVGEFFSDFKESAPALGDYHQLNMRFGISLDKWRIEVFGTNLLNEDAMTWYRQSSFYAFRLRPRTLGLELGFNF